MWVRAASKRAVATSRSREAWSEAFVAFAHLRLTLKGAVELDEEETGEDGHEERQQEADGGDRHKLGRARYRVTLVSLRPTSTTSG